MGVDKLKVESFWQKFNLLAKAIIRKPDDSEIICILDTYVHQLGDYDWEYGPSKKKELYFCLSPNMRVDLIEEVDDIIRKAPEIEYWEIISCKPKKKELISKFFIENEKGEEILIDTKGWKCIAYKFPNGTYDLDILLNKIEGNEETKYLAIDIHLTNLMGERKYITLIEGVTIVSSIEGEIKQKSFSVESISKFVI